MDSSNLVEQTQKICLQILSFFSDYAQKNNITYYMAGGTMLGAVRHKGFIPWDDDVDLMLPRDDYDKLIRNFEDERYALSSCETDPSYNSPFARLWDTKTKINWLIVDDKEIGVFIDLFPIDGFPCGNLKTQIHLFHIKVVRALLNITIRTGFRNGEKYRKAKEILKYFIRKDGNYFSIRLNTIAQKYKFSNSEYVGVKTTIGHLFHEKNRKSIFCDTLWLPFESLTLPAPVGYDVYLRHLYGDYMKLLPVEKRHSDHYFTVENL